MLSVRSSWAMPLQGDDDNYCGLRCLQGAAKLLGASYPGDGRWAERAKRNGLARKYILEIADEIGLRRADEQRVKRQLRDWTIGEIERFPTPAAWIARTYAALPDRVDQSKTWRGPHYVLILAIERNAVDVGDPYLGRAPIPRARFEHDWNRQKCWAVPLVRARA